MGPLTLLDGLDATGAALFHRDRWWRVGETPTGDELDGLGRWLSTRPELASSADAVYATDTRGADYPPGAAFAATASGVLAVSPSRDRRDLMVWFRAETVRTVNWGGNPHDKPMVAGPNGPRLTPRASFALFAESVRGRALPWKAVELDAALRLRVLVMELVVDRANQLADLNTDLSRSNEELDAFAYVASHDLKEPLRGIHKYAHQLLERATITDEENCQKLDGLMRLTVRMDGLLDSLMNFSRVGRAALELEDVDLNEVVSEAIEMVDARRAAGQTEITIPRPLPHARCDRMRCREIFVNLLSNALKYSDRSEKRIEVGYVAGDEAHPRANCPPRARTETLFYVEDNGIGIRAQHYPQLFRMLKRLHGHDAYGGGTGAGLSIVKRLVERHHGQVWVDSTFGEGTTFYFSLPGQPSRS